MTGQTVSKRDAKGIASLFSIFGDLAEPNRVDERREDGRDDFDCDYYYP